MRKYQNIILFKKQSIEIFHIIRKEKQTETIFET